ncbi:ATP-binding protein [Flavisolibacter nicotianae]|uniref:ATP-binding protein n=1 Tax=Flavisolibacter nicotianae TaxID=2364882 RepID=UPI000EB0C9B8|nr:ATP-binding protein [Flavisolibacter nicotianae]
MKPLLFALLLFFSSTHSQQLEKRWETDSVVAVPESVLPDTQNGLLYVSLIDGNPWDADAKGGIARLKDDGTNYDSAWVKGLNAPKGLGLYKNHLYVADISEVVVINTKTAQAEKRIPIPGASGLNDITVTDEGIIYVSDSKTARIWRLEKEQPVLFLENMQGVNGLKAVGRELYIASGKSFVKADENKTITKLAELPQPGDGIEPLGNGDFLASAWSGYIFYVSANGTVKTLLETSASKKNTADIGYDPVKKIVYVPTFFAKTVAAYQLK